MLSFIKDFLKDKFLILKIRNRFIPSVQITQRQLFLQYQAQAKENKLSKISDTGFKVFSQFEEDGMLLFIFSVIGMNHKTFIEIGSDDGINSNAANLYFNFGWHGVFIDANAKSIARGKNFFSKYPHPYFYAPTFISSKVTPENINNLIKQSGYEGTVGLLSIDIDSDDYWIWNAIEIAQPQVVIIETKVEFGMHDVVVPYSKSSFSNPLYQGASPFAITQLANRKGYRLVGGNERGINFIYLKNGLADHLIPEVNVESLLTHPDAIKSFEEFEKVKHLEFVKG